MSRGTKKKRGNKQKANNKIVNLYPNISIITLNVNGFNQGLANFFCKRDRQ